MRRECGGNLSEREGGGNLPKNECGVICLRGSVG